MQSEKYEVQSDLHLPLITLHFLSGMAFVSPLISGSRLAVVDRRSERF